MTRNNKQIAIDVINRLPGKVSLRQIAQSIEFVSGIHEGAAQLGRGEYLSAEQAMRQIPQFARCAPPGGPAK
jgi:hypothetical protein